MLNKSNAIGFMAWRQRSEFSMRNLKKKPDWQAETTASEEFDVGKRLRPNYRDGKVVLYVSPVRGEPSHWLAERVV